MADVAYIGPGGRESRPLLRTSLGEVLRRHRRDQGRTLADVARAAKVSVPYLSEVERGRKEASSEVLAAVCDALRIELADLLLDVGRDLNRAAVIRQRQALISRPSAMRPSAPRTAAPRSTTARPGDAVLLAA